MSRTFSMISVAAALTFGAAAANAAEYGDMFSFRGFGTLGVVHSSEENADFVGGLFQPDGAGYTREWNMRSDTRLAGQLSAEVNDKWSAVVQALTQYQHDGTFKPQVEWANVKFQATPELSVRAGRIALPNFMASESRFIGYANTWVRQPQEMYFAASITSNDGVDATYSFQTGAVTDTVRAFYGSSEVDLASGSIEAEKTWGLNYAAQVGSMTLHAGYVEMAVNIDIPSTDPLFGGLTGLGNMLTGFGFAAEGAEALSLARKYRLDDMNISFLSLGGNYDQGDWFVTAEVLEFTGDGFLSDARAGYVAGGYRIGSFTPYAMFAALKSDIPFEPGISTTGLGGGLLEGAAGLNAGVNATLNQFNASQSTASAGVRWDFHRSAAFKIQYERVDAGKNSAGRFTNTQPGFELGGTSDVVSMTVDFIF